MHSLPEYTVKSFIFIAMVIFKFWYIGKSKKEQGSGLNFEKSGNILSKYISGKSCRERSIQLTFTEHILYSAFYVPGTGLVTLWVSFSFPTILQGVYPSFT